jgi:hypothetical protein
MHAPINHQYLLKTGVTLKEPQVLLVPFLIHNDCWMTWYILLSPYKKKNVQYNGINSKGDGKHADQN